MPAAESDSGFVDRLWSRIKQEGLYQNRIKTNTSYLTLRERIYNQDLEIVECSKLYSEETIALAASEDTEDELWEFVTQLTANLVQLASRIHHREDDVRTKLVEFIIELKKVVVTDPRSPTGEQLCDPESVPNYIQKLWTDLPQFGLCCSEEEVSFGKSCGPDFPRRRCNLY